MRRTSGYGIAALSLALASVLCGYLVLENAAYAHARAGCTKCKTIKTSYCGGIGSNCATYTVRCPSNECASCVNEISSYIDITPSTSPTDGVEQHGDPTDCGNKTTGGTC